MTPDFKFLKNYYPAVPTYGLSQMNRFQSTRDSFEKEVASKIGHSKQFIYEINRKWH
jgi:hypothetical protein